MRTDTFEGTTELKNLLERVDRLKAEIDALRPLSPEQEARVMQKFRLDWNYHSNAIEGNSLTYGETIAFLMEGLTAKGKPFKDHLDIKGHNEAINYLMDLIKHRNELGERDIRDLHKMILVEPYATPARTASGQIVEKQVTLGAYKTMPNHIKTPTGETHYYATPEETPAKMADLVAWLRDHQQKQDMHPLVVAAIFHYRFVAIHPFDDGNGRMSRLLMNLLLMQDAYPPVVIRQQARKEYYYALRQADAGDLEPFVTFIGENLLHSMDLYLRGARGESIEDQDDLDKEIALLKAGFDKNQINNTKKTAEDVEIIVKGIVFSFFNYLLSDATKINELFISNKVTLRFNHSNNYTPIFDLSATSISQILERGLIHWDLLEAISLVLDWEGFNRHTIAFNINRYVFVSFNEYNYTVSSENSFKELMENSYNKQKSTQEIKSWSDTIIRSILAEIKSKTT